MICKMYFYKVVELPSERADGKQCSYRYFLYREIDFLSNVAKFFHEFAEKSTLVDFFRNEYRKIHCTTEFKIIDCLRPAPRIFQGIVLIMINDASERDIKNT